MSRYQVEDGQLAQAVLERPVAKAPPRQPQPERRKSAARSVSAPRPKVATPGDDAVWKEF
jgi:hypothetical protein